MELGEKRASEKAKAVDFYRWLCPIGADSCEAPVAAGTGSRGRLLSFLPPTRIHL